MAYTVLKLLLLIKIRKAITSQHSRSIVIMVYIVLLLLVKRKLRLTRCSLCHSRWHLHLFGVCETSFSAKGVLSKALNHGRRSGPGQQPGGSGWVRGGGLRLTFTGQEVGPDPGCTLSQASAASLTRQWISDGNIAGWHNADNKSSVPPRQSTNERADIPGWSLLNKITQ